MPNLDGNTTLHAEANAEALPKAVNEGAASARTLFVTLMVLALYIFIVVSGTDDEMLLRDSTIAVPTLSNATVPASAFYAIAPWIFLFLHLDLLIHFQLLAGKLRCFNYELSRLPAGDGRDDFRVRLASFPRQLTRQRPAPQRLRVRSAGDHCLADAGSPADRGASLP
ncbi:MAG: hypothetical protein NFW04_06280, partial [Candidatus Accumulibacter sp.]|nr:hypothetical protein [Accumulibacter sp.]